MFTRLPLFIQDVTNAAMLNESTDAALNIVMRANAATQISADGVHQRFAGFAAHYEDYQPAVDQLSMMRIALHEMLLGRLDDENETLLLFPGFPANVWDARFKLRGPRNTTVEAACVGGKLTQLVVTPPERIADVVVLNCEA